ncbi:MAG TPA: serine/threonine-protein kinase [Polyangia bacterium]
MNDTVPTDLRVGRFVGSYRIERRLPGGGMAELFLARAPAGMLDVERAVVLKALPAALASDAHWLSMFYDEARLAARLDHPSLVRVLDLLLEDGRPHIVMEYVDGRDLRFVLRRAQALGMALPPGLACHIAAELLGALAYVHSRRDPSGRPLGLVHRDVSPANLMITFAGGVKLIDFGIAKAAQQLRSELTAAGQFKGKCSYSAPEQVRCGEIDARADLFAAGIVLWELVSGRRLFARPTDLGSLRAILHEPIPRLGAFAADVPEALESIAVRALAREPGERYASAEAMRADLEALIRGQSWPAGSLELERFMASLFADEPHAEAMLPPPELSSVENEAATQIEVRLPEAEMTELSLDAELPEIDIDVDPVRPPPIPYDPPTSITPLPSAAALPSPAAPPSPSATTMPLATVSWPEPAPRAARRWSRALVAAVVALGLLGAALATALRLHF